MDGWVVIACLFSALFVGTFLVSVFWLPKIKRSREAASPPTGRASDRSVLHPYFSILAEETSLLNPTVTTTRPGRFLRIRQRTEHILQRLFFR